MGPFISLLIILTLSAFTTTHAHTQPPKPFVKPLIATPTTKIFIELPPDTLRETSSPQIYEIPVKIESNEEISWLSIAFSWDPKIFALQEIIHHDFLGEPPVPFLEAAKHVIENNPGNTKQTNTRLGVKVKNTPSSIELFYIVFGELPRKIKTRNLITLRFRVSNPIKKSSPVLVFKDTGLGIRSKNVFADPLRTGMIFLPVTRQTRTPAPLK